MLHTADVEKEKTDRLVLQMQASHAGAEAKYFLGILRKECIGYWPDLSWIKFIPKNKQRQRHKKIPEKLQASAWFPGSSLFMKKEDTHGR